ncbi:MAG: M23 family peptidase [Chitinophagaceae bacterium]|nr:MAG: M23 family peptidase [Chitinophagaceae bacterium]
MCFFAGMRRSLICSIFCITIIFSSAQGFNNPYPQGYFRWPVDLRPEIVANLGELRPNHWHMGLDVRTGGHENERVYAAADGYIAFIGIKPSGFGRHIVINHPNGLSTLYAHLNDFAPEIERWVTEHQYLSESWPQELRPDNARFPVRKGDFISYSGNTGGSQGPHVHFEIRSTSTDECLNPLLFGFNLADNVPPVLQQLALYDRSQSIYNSGRPQAYVLRATDTGYIIPKMPVVTTDLPVIGFGLKAFDRLSGSSNQDGIYSAELFVDGRRLTGFKMDSISYDETGYYNAHVDYRNHYRGGVEYQLMNGLPNDRGGVYRMEGDGSLRLYDTLTHDLRVEVRDAAQNLSVLRFRLRFRPAESSRGVGAVAAERLIPGIQQKITRPDFELTLRPENIYDTVNLYYAGVKPAPGRFSGTYAVNDESIPVHQLLKVSIRPAYTVDALQRDRVLVLRSGGRSDNIRKAVWEGDRVTAEFSDFGTFSAYTDLIPPVINAPGKGDTINLSSNTRLMFTPSDASGIKSFRAEINGRWIRFTNDKSRNWIYRFDERVPYGVHELMVRVEDVAGNITEKKWWFRRAAYTPPPPRKGKGKKTPVKKTTSKVVKKKR